MENFQLTSVSNAQVVESLRNILNFLQNIHVIVEVGTLFCTIQHSTYKVCFDFDKEYKL